MRNFNVGDKAWMATSSTNIKYKKIDCSVGEVIIHNIFDDDEFVVLDHEENAVTMGRRHLHQKKEHAFQRIMQNLNRWSQLIDSKNIKCKHTPDWHEYNARIEREEHYADPTVIYCIKCKRYGKIDE